MTKKKIIGYVSGAAVAVSLAIGSNMLNSMTDDIITQLPMQEESIIQETEPTASPVVSPSPTPSPTAKPKNTEPPQETIEPIPTEIPLSTLEMFGISGEITVEGTYSVNEIDANRSEFSVVIPEKLSADIYELYLNGQFVDKQLLPGKIIAPPVIFSMPKLLEVRIFKLQEVIAVGRFEGEKLIIAVKDGVLND